MSAFPGPIEAKAPAVPSDHRFGLDDHQGGALALPETRQPDPKETITRLQEEPPTTAPQYVDLVAQSMILQLQTGAALETGT